MTTILAVNKHGYFASKQGDDCATNLEQGQDDVSSSLETLPNNVAGWVEVCRGSPGKEYVASEANNGVGASAKKKKITTHVEDSKLETWHKREQSTYQGMHPASIGNMTRTAFIRDISDCS